MFTPLTDQTFISMRGKMLTTAAAVEGLPCAAVTAARHGIAQLPAAGPFLRGGGDVIVWRVVRDVIHERASIRARVWLNTRLRALSNAR